MHVRDMTKDHLNSTHGCNIKDDFIYVNPQPGEAEIKNFYTKEYFNSEKRFGYQNYLELEKSLKEAEKLLYGKK